MRFCIMGDICPSYNKQNDYNDILREIVPVINSADYRIANLECVALSDNSICKPISKTGPNLKIGENELLILDEAGIDVAILANNHVGDYGEAGVQETIAAIRKHNMICIGAGKNIEEAYRPVYFSENGLTVCMLAVCENEFGVADNNKAGVAGYDGFKVWNLIKKEKELGHVVIIIFHGGNEYNPLPSPEAQKRYRELARMGADVIVGMHTHCPQGYEIFGKTLIIYSLGNFFFPQVEGRTGEYDTWNFGYIAQIEISNNGSSLNVFPYKYDVNLKCIRVLKEKNHTCFVQYLEKISKIIASKEELEKCYYAWCTKYGKAYARHLKVVPNGQDEECKNALEIENMFRCEAHRELLCRYYGLVAKGEVLQYEKKWIELKKLMFIPQESKYNRIIQQLFCIDDTRELINYIIAEERVIIYGAGKISNKLLEIIKCADLVSRVVGIVVTKQEENPSIFNGIGVVSLEKSGYENHFPVIIATGHCYQAEIRDLLLEKGYTSLALISKEYEIELNR